MAGRNPPGPACGRRDTCLYGMTTTTTSLTLQSLLLDIVARAGLARMSAFSAARDIAAGYGCIDCGKPFEPQKPGGSVDAGHYLSRGSAPHLAFDERNVHAQRKNCNRPGGATAAEYRAGLVERIGHAAVEELEADQESRRYRDDDYRRIRDEYRAKLKELKARTA